MWNKIILVLIMLTGLSVIAGNTLGDQQTIDVDGFSVGYKSPYNLAKNQTILFDEDFPEELANEVIIHMNNILVDISLDQEFSTIDYGSASEIFSFDPRFNKMYEPNRIFIHVGSGFSSAFFAALRVYENGDPSCFIHLRKTLWDQVDDQLKKGIALHEVFHCMKWQHPEDNPYVDNFDFINDDNVEVLERLYDSNNTENKILVSITKVPTDVIGFIAHKNTRGQRSVYTRDDQVKLTKGTYKVQVNDKYIRKITKSGKIKYTRKLKKAKKFNFNDGNTKEFTVIEEII